MTQVARFWFQNTFARRWPSYLALVLLIGAVGGVAMGSLSGARRTASSYNTFLASTNPSDMSVLMYARNISSELAGLPLVRRVSVVAFYVGVTPAGSDGAPGNYPAQQSGAVYPV